MVAGSIYVLDPTAGGALTLSGNASINTRRQRRGRFQLTSAILASGNAQVTAASVQVVGECQQERQRHGHHDRHSTGATATRSPGWRSRPSHSPAAPSPRTSAATPPQTINPGLYSQINVSGNAKLTLNPGVYVIAGGGFTASGNAVRHRRRVTSSSRGRLHSRATPSSTARRDDLQRRQQYTVRRRRHFRQHHAERQRHLELTATDHRDVRQHPDLPVPPTIRRP